MSGRRIVVVGAGDCGARVALRLRELGFDGDVTLIGNDPNAPYERPALSKEVLVDDETSPRSILDEVGLDEWDITWRRGERAARLDIDRRLVELEGGTGIRYDRLVIATGARARPAAVPGPNVITTLRSFDDAVALRTRLEPGVRLLVIGGGFIGLEVAASARTRGCEVTVIEFAHRLMTRVVPAAVAEVFHRRHLAEGVDLRCGVGVERIDRANGGLAAHLSDGSAVGADVVVAGIGAIPNTELAATAGLAISNGVAVDGHLRTADPNVYAAGDCCSVPHPLFDGRRVRLEAWRSALAQAEVAATNLLDGDAVFDAVPWFWSDQYDLGMQIAGLHDAATIDVARRRDDGIELHFGLGPDGRLVSASGVGVGTAVARDIRVAEMLIAERATPAATDLSDPSCNLRSLLPTLDTDEPNDD